MNTKKAGIAALLISVFALSACAAESQTVTGEPQTTKTASNNNTAMTQNNASELQLKPPAAGEKIAIIETDMGTIKVKLFSEIVPEISKNFETLANSGKYNGVPFHRVMKDFMIQTGDFTKKNGTGGYSYKGPGTELDDEISPALKHLYGTVSMANKGPDTNGSQFFIVTNKNGTPHLNGGYSIFGQVYEGIDIALQIADLQVTGTEKPSREILMNKVTVSTYTP